MEIFGSSGLIGPITLLVCGLGSLLCFILRKSVFNDLASMSFSIIGSISGLCVGYVIVSNIPFLGMKFGIVAGLIGMFAGGILIGDRLNDGDAS